LRASAKSLAKPDPGLWAVVLAGGIGSRFWPVSTPARPKQLLPLGSEDPLIVDTTRRARALVSDDRLRILAGDHLVRPFQSVLDLPDSSYWVEPAVRGTCPVLAWAAWEIHQQDPDAVMVSLHSDHRIEPLSALQETVFAAAQIARRDELLLCIGAAPDRIETGYGHVEPGAPIPSDEGIEAFHVSAFHEKPDAETADRYVKAGFLWNTGIFVWKASTFLAEVERHAPEVAACLPLLEESPERFFSEVPVCVVDTAIMERSDRVGTVKALFDWDDVGSWGALTRTREADADGNRIVGDGAAVDGSGNIVFSEAGKVVLFGMDDTVAVRTGDVTLVMPRDKAADVKALLKALEDADS